MKISKYLWIEKGTKFNRLKKMQLKMQNKCKDQVYLVCTSSQHPNLFDIIESQYLTSQYNACYLVAVTQSKEAAIKHVGVLINQLYNLRTISYDAIKT